MRLAALVVALGVLSGTAQAQNAGRLATTGQCLMGREAYSVTDVPASTTSQAFAVMPGSTVSFVQGGGGTCVVVRLSTSDYLCAQFRPTIDGVRKAVPIDQFFEVANGGPLSFEWVFQDIAPGAHTFTMQWRARHVCTTAQVGIRTITVRSR